MEPEIKIRGYHTDLYAHVNNARYLEFLEEGRWQLLEDHIDLNTFTQKGFLFFIVNINISYRSQAKVDDVVTIKSGLKKIGKTSAVIRQLITNKETGKVIVDADITFVITNETQKPLIIDGELKEIIKRLPVLEG